MGSGASAEILGTLLGPLMVASDAAAVLHGHLRGSVTIAAKGTFNVADDGVHCGAIDDHGPT